MQKASEVDQSKSLRVHEARETLRDETLESDPPIKFNRVQSLEKSINRDDWNRNFRVTSNPKHNSRERIQR